MDENFIGTISLVPTYWIDECIKNNKEYNYKCEGQKFVISNHNAFFSLVAHQFDTVEDPAAFHIPDLRGKAIKGFTYCINSSGYYPARESTGATPTSDYTGSVILFPYQFEPNGFYLCDGRELPIDGNTELFSLLGFQYGGDNKTKFCIPNLLGKSPIKNTRYYICKDGPYPGEKSYTYIGRDNYQFAADLRLFALEYMPYDYLACEGQILNTKDYETLFAKIGNYFGGDGITTFALPDLRKDEFSNLRFGMCVLGNY